MRILVVADIHANAAALEAVREPHDVCLCLGDLVEYGPDPAACVDWARAHATHAVRGNHDHGAAQRVRADGTTGYKYLTAATRPPTVAALPEADRRFLAGLPTTRMLTLGGKRFLMVHATPRDPLDEYVECDPKAWAARAAGVDADFLLVGHTHVQFELPVGKLTVVNPGSVGLPRNGDPRCRYAVIDDGKVELKRVEYDVERTVAAVRGGPLDARAKELLTSAYRNGRLPAPPAPPSGIFARPPAGPAG